MTLDALVTFSVGAIVGVLTTLGVVALLALSGANGEDDARRFP